MTIYSEGVHSNEFLISEANGSRSRKTVIVTGGNYKAGQVMKLDTGKYSASSTDGSDAVAVLLSAVDASVDDQQAVIIARDSEVSNGRLAYSSTARANQRAADNSLATLGIVVINSI